MNNQTELEKVMAERGLSRSQAKMYLDGLDHMARTEGQADFTRGYDDGESQTTVDQNHYNGATK